MTIDKQALRDIAEKTKIAGEAPVMPFEQRINALNDFMKHFTPATALAMLDELEASAKQNALDIQIKARLCRESNSLHDRLREAEKRIAELREWNAGLAQESFERQSRIAELESRTVTLEPFRSFVTDADIAALHRFAECCDDPESGGHDLEKEQVRRLEAIGALQRSGRISYITDFGDVLISITAGIGKGK